MIGLGGMTRRRLGLAIAAAALLLVALPDVALADNCSSLVDCAGLLEAAALALAAMAIFAFLFFNPGLLLAAAGFLESLLFTPMGWITGWGRAGAVAVGESMTAAELSALRASLIAQDLQALGPAAFNAAGGTTNCFGVSGAVLGWAESGVATSAIPAFGIDLGTAAATVNSQVIPTTFEAIASGLASEGAGAGGYVGVIDTVSGLGHFFAGANINGTVIFADMQATAAVSASAAEVAGAAGYLENLLVFFVPL